MGQLIRYPLAQDTGAVVGMRRAGSMHDTVSLHDRSVPEGPPVPDPVELAVRRTEAHAETARQQGFHDGYRAGFLQGELDGEREGAPLRARLQDLLAALPGQQQQAWDRVEALAVPVVMAALVRLVGSLSVSTEFVRASVCEALAQVGRDEDCVLHLHPADLDALQRTLEPMLADRPRLGLQADPGVTGGGCVIGTARGDIDAQWTVQLARLGMALAGRAA